MKWLVIGADRATGEDKEIFIDAESEKSAIRKANRRGLFVAELQPRPTIKAIVIRPPWCHEIRDGTKRIEYRSWHTKYRGLLAIVAARRKESGHDAGHIVCFVRLTNCVEMGPRDFEWKLSRPMSIAERIEIPGQLGLFDVTDQLPRTLLDRLAKIA